ncbi:Dynlt1 [Symbiodinium natans]|uniref:Dynlt1 protein n=1 Tax=Symbiodinium natans TaxID=878477 RepID=A0A812NLZ8_9DINO|nr:Dynlt1 [Symbiodinium natans]
MARLGGAAEAVRTWVSQVVLHHGLCPWAQLAEQSKVVTYLTCEATTPAAVGTAVRAEAARLVSRRVPWATSLVVCPHVVPWQEDFRVFDDWVARSNHLDDLEDLVSLVAFHPRFARWHALDPSVTEGTQVTSHYEEVDGEKSKRALPAVVECLDPKQVGVRRIGIRFIDDGVLQWVPMDWLSPSWKAAELLADNQMHQAPFPTVHLIRRKDLASVRCSKDGYEVVASIQARNSQHLSKLRSNDLVETKRKVVADAILPVLLTWILRDMLSGGQE